MTRDDLFNINAGIVATLAEGVARHCPRAWVLIISNPVNSTVPIAAEVFKRAGTYDPARLFGVTTLDVVRAETFIAEILGVVRCPWPLVAWPCVALFVVESSLDWDASGVVAAAGKKGGARLELQAPVKTQPTRQLKTPQPPQQNTPQKHQQDPRDVTVPVVGGHAGATILPLLSQCRPPLQLEAARARQLMARIQDAGTEVVQAKAGAGSATLSMAYAAARFAEACLRAMAGERGVVECAFVASALTSLPFFASPVRLGRGGVEELLPIGAMNDLEQRNYDQMLPELAASIQKGAEFAQKRAAAGGGGGGGAAQ